MILFLDRRNRIQFSFASRCARGLVKKHHADERIRKLQGGPGAVMRTIIKQMKLDDPPLYWDLCLRDFPVAECDVAWVVNDPAHLEWAVRNRDRLRARQLWAGPNIVVVPQEEQDIITAPQIDRLIIPARWVADFYSREASELATKISLWPAAIDTDLWRPAHEPKVYWVIYNKYQDVLAAEIVKVLQSMNTRFTQINYGRYLHDKYREILKNAKGVIWLSRSESQGIALLEALSMDVPALVWDPGTWHYQSPELKRDFTASATSAPYFSEACGLRFTSSREFESTFKTFAESSNSYHPREYVLEAGLDLRTNKQRIIDLIQDV
jgi:glycosyltransferase involved in cell wall biosynthesis